MDTDEKVRGELNRKPRVEFIKEKNQEELQKSFAKVKSSISPKKMGSGIRSPYKSSYYGDSGIQ